ncbi:hypothetical protein GCM10009808_15080 [Microbacterium sediminicola]|uniref:DNA modification methylase n=1 Tax=Microbacterium sediminicola TaxID=415210 RepID=A0ABN2I4L8_9MICO
MKSRLVASLVVGGALVLGTTGCSMISTQATTIEYAAAEGANIPDTAGPVQVRNAFIVANEEGTLGNFVAALVNRTDKTEVLYMEFGEDKVAEKVIVPANTIISLGSDYDEPLLVSGIDSKPGSDIAVSFQSGDGVTWVQAIPVLNGDLDYLAPLVP